MKLLYKLGLIKISLEEGKDILKRMFDVAAQKISEESKSAYPNHTKVEVKIWIWVYISPILEKHLPDEMYYEMMEYIGSKVVPCNLASIKEIATSSKIDDRIIFHRESLKSLQSPQPPIGSYPQVLYAMLFEQPLGELEEIISGENIVLDVDSIMKKQIYANNLITYVLPGASEATKKILKMIRKK